MPTAWYRTKDILPANGQDVVWLDYNGDERQGRFWVDKEIEVQPDEPPLNHRWQTVDAGYFIKVDFWRPLTEINDHGA